MLMANSLAAPAQDPALVSTTETFPLIVPKVTLIVLLLGPVAPEVMEASSGTLHA